MTDQTPLFDLPAARREGEKGMAKAINAERVQEWRYRADQWLASLEPYTVITADSLTAAVGLPDTGKDRNNSVGAFFSGHAKKGTIRWTGNFVQSKRVERHGNMQRRWIVQPH